MRIVMFTDAYPPYINGVATSCYNLVQVLKQNGHDVLVIAPQADDGPTKRDGNIIYMKGIALKKMYGYRLTALYSSKIFKIIKSFKPEVFHIQTDFTIGQFARRVSKKMKYIPTVYTYHTAYEDYTYYAVKSGLLDRVAKKFVRSYAKNAAKTMTEYITPSEKTKAYMRSVGSDAYINVIPTGLDFSIFKKENVDYNRIEEFKKAHGVDKDTKVFLILGRVAQEKSMDVSINGFHAYRQAYPNQKVKMFVVGDGPQKNDLEKLAEDLGEKDNIEFLGSVPASEVPFYYHLADIYTSASVTETQGLTFMESMASGTPVLARFDTQLENVIIDNETGFFFTDIDSFVVKANRILSLSKEELEQVRNKAYVEVDAYSIDKFYENIIRVYQRAIRKKW